MIQIDRKMTEAIFSLLLLLGFLSISLRSMGVPIVCYDEKEEQPELCDPICQSCIPGGCNLTKPADFCFISAGCWPNGYVFQEIGDTGGSRCQLSCNTAHSSVAWSPAPTGTPCDDGIFCNGHDFCEYDEESNKSSCTGGVDIDPCENMTKFCNSMCNEQLHNCFRVEDTPCNTTQPLTCLDTGVCAQGRCAEVSKAVPPLCTECPHVCDHINKACNQTSGVCMVLKKISADLDPRISWPLVLGISASVLVIILLAAAGVIYVVKRAKRRYQGSRLEYYHRVMEDDNRSAGLISDDIWCHPD